MCAPYSRTYSAHEPQYWHDVSKKLNNCRKIYRIHENQLTHFRSVDLSKNYDIASKWKSKFLFFSFEAFLHTKYIGSDIFKYLKDFKPFLYSPGQQLLHEQILSEFLNFMRVLFCDYLVGYFHLNRKYYGWQTRHHQLYFHPLSRFVDTILFSSQYNR